MIKFIEQKVNLKISCDTINCTERNSTTEELGDEQNLV
jgi:hypothetical protein